MHSYLQSKIAPHRLMALLAVLILPPVTAPSAAGQAQHPTLSHAHSRLAQAADVASQKGFHAKLPPHISTLLGLNKEQETPVMQSVVRTGPVVQGLDVSVANKNDIVLFIVDESANNQTLYLTSPEGTLRKVVSVKAGVGTAARPTPQDTKSFQKEKQFWLDRLTPARPAK